MGSSYARMMRRMMSARIDDVAVATPIDPIGREPEPEAREGLHALVAARGPAPLEQHDELRRMRVEAPEKLFAQPPDRTGLDIVIEVEVVDEPRRLDGAQAQQRVDPGLRRVQHLNEILPRDPAFQARHDRAHPALLRRDPRGVGRRYALRPEQRPGRDDTRQERQRREAAGFEEPRQLGEEPDGGERREWIQMVLPALALTDEVGGAVAEADADDRVPRGEAAARDRGSDRARHTGG